MASTAAAAAADNDDNLCHSGAVLPRPSCVVVVVGCCVFVIDDAQDSIIGSERPMEHRGYDEREWLLCSNLFSSYLCIALSFFLTFPYHDEERPTHVGRSYDAAGTAGAGV